jgi:putative PIN family toxin of toxin-antitoxin system
MPTRVVLDTNVVVSAAIVKEGNPAKIFEMLLLEEIENYTTKEIIEEIKDVLNRPRITKRLKQKDKEFITETFKQLSIIVNPEIKINQLEVDPDDNKFLECAVTAKANYIISGDDHLLNLKSFKDILILTPAEFVKIKLAK